ncbi:CRISPR-associated endonuclease Cas2 [Vagococcus acidifermentans]|uniref:CRISPR-associated endoribonuclease Cas2 n=1 Tax=Vagococcus acidifermentans TaxID=564710 RepID=A0A430AQT8_9ENTE|nr:CRISPR-associated endonuclease Cas2 [Vagococcus acidifermentans]RSU10479.1 CRISPR-associated endonuclease Cas2 [Vagococcus acidifermentans]
MLVLITYDVATSSAGGTKRLRRVAKKCLDHGQRVQHSVFECVCDAATLAQLKIDLRNIIDEEQDSLRFYILGKNYRQKIEHFGVKESYDVEGTLMF